MDRHRRLTSFIARVRILSRLLSRDLELDMHHPQLGDTVSIHIGWKLPDGHRLAVTFEARIEAFETDNNRLRCRLLRVMSSGGSQPEANVAPRYFDLVLALVGKRALVPLDALEGIVLPLRLATLTGEHHFFFD